MTKPLSHDDIETIRKTGRDEVARATTIGLAELDALCDTAQGKLQQSKDRKHNHYFKSVADLAYVDVYRVLALFNVTDPCLQHAVKKLLVAGVRGGGKDISRDIQEAIDTLTRWQEMRGEELPK